MENTSEIKQVVGYVQSGKWEEDLELIQINYQIKSQEIVPNFAHVLAKFTNM